MLKYTITFVEESDKDAFDEEVREDKLYYRVSIPEKNMNLEVRSTPGSNMFEFHLVGKGHPLPKALAGFFTSRKFIEDALAAYCAAKENQVKVQQEPKPKAPQFVSNEKVN